MQYLRSKIYANRDKGEIVKARKAYTLVEVVVAFAVFMIILIGVTTTFTFSAKMQKRGENFVHFETICLDIDTFSDKYGREWDLNYFGEKQDSASIYYNSQYEKTTQENAQFELSYYYTVSNELIVNVKDVNTNFKIIENLNYGGNRYAQI